MMSFDVGVALVNDGSKTENQALYIESYLFVHPFLTEGAPSIFKLVAMPLIIEAGGKAGKVVSNAVRFLTRLQLKALHPVLKALC